MQMETGRTVRGVGRKYGSRTAGLNGVDLLGPLTRRIYSRHHLAVSYRAATPARRKRPCLTRKSALLFSCSMRLPNGHPFDYSRDTSVLRVTSEHSLLQYRSPYQPIRNLDRSAESISHRAIRCRGVTGCGKINCKRVKTPQSIP